ncbi:hypothetical protein [Aquisphaera giovannonii]|uniref:hypothetical protein n=1 Tax=Aquisphaera giovannonii TaxID=406548 RepID=UPI0011DFEEF4|nr:hypothetical protein [Aquisphaera giovannonii]
MAPHAGRLTRPSLYSDDVIRVAQLQTIPLTELLLRPFNEHIAPLFQLVSWVTWQACGHRLTAAPYAFTAASLAPFLLALGALFALVRREARSATAGLLACSAFSLSAVHLEAAWWYSGSSFTWALLATIVAWAWTIRALDLREAGEPSRNAWVVAAVSAMAAPAFSAIGLLAGPVAMVRAALDPRLKGREKTGAIIPLVGTVFYLAGAGLLRYDSILTASVHHNGDLVGGILAAMRAPADVLFPGFLGVANLDGLLGGGFDIAITSILLAAVTAWCSRSAARPAIVTGLSLIAGGYALTYCVRNQFGSHWLLEVQRYHLFPQLGLVLILAMAARRPLARLDGRPLAAMGFAASIAAVLLAVQIHRIREAGRPLSFPAQARSLIALEDLEQICRHRHLGRDEIVASLPPVRPRWFPHDGSILDMIPASPSSGRAPAEVLRIVLDSLAPRDLESLLGGMDATALLAFEPAPLEGRTIARGNLIASVGVRAEGPARWRAGAHRALLDFQLDRSAEGTARHLCIPGLDPAHEVELWWAGDREPWTEARSIRWAAGAPGATAIPLDRVPHWSAGHAHRVRLVVKSDGPIVVEAPRLLR